MTTSGPPPSVQRHRMFRLELDEEDEEWRRAVMAFTPARSARHSRGLKKLMQARAVEDAAAKAKAEAALAAKLQAKPAGTIPSLGQC